jgi:NADH-quinone oxidoreductase subunit F
MIILRGAPWFLQIGNYDPAKRNGGSTGTKVFSLVGKVNNSGLVEVPMGITLREIIFDIGGGIPGGKRFKAVQTGGPSGGCLPERLLDLPVDYDSLLSIGSMMGSGGMIVMDENTCMVDLARYFIDFLKDESCGKCMACREGLRNMHRILTDITEGRGKEGDIELLEQLGQAMVDASLCALGGTAPNPVLSTIREFRDEYEAHIKYKRCPAAVCDKLIFTPCKFGCPLDTDAATFVALAAKGQYQEAFEIIRKNNPFPLVTSYACHHPCEYRCRAGEFGDAISVKAVKRFVCDHQLQTGIPPLPRPTRRYPEDVAVVGGGPAGLTAAWELVRMGYGATVFEAASFLGGMVAAAIPRYRLSADILEMEIESIVKSGVNVRTNMELGKDITLDELARDYKAVFLATGAHESRKLGIPGEDLEGVIDGLVLLKEINAGKKVELGERVAVVGGGNTAIDAARTAWRLGSQVTILYRRTIKEMPAMETEIAAGIEEEAVFEYLVAPVRVLGDQGRIRAVECVRMELGEMDESGRRRPKPIAGSEFAVEVDSLIAAIGERPNVDFLTGDSAAIVSGRGLVGVDSETLATAMQGVFAGGDAVTGPSTISDSIAQGRLAARNIHRHLRGESMKPTYKPVEPSPHIAPVALSDEELEEIMEADRSPMPTMPIAQRRDNFEGVELGLNEEMAVKESKRCLRCDLRDEEE